MSLDHRSVVFCTVDNFWCPDHVRIRSRDLEIVFLGAPVGVDSKTHDGLRNRHVETSPQSGPRNTHSKLSS